jgi:hypothetical protein
VSHTYPLNCGWRVFGPPTFFFFLSFSFFLSSLIYIYIYIYIRDIILFSPSFLLFIFVMLFFTLIYHINFTLIDVTYFKLLLLFIINKKTHEVFEFKIGQNLNFKSMELKTLIFKVKQRKNAQGS